ncbi:hypothetical protein EA462_00650 [Natrarchaeobius halalkaliphilus]|uniref:Uncharacterized protein n=1 Tax=Natrarchaeobius halalkaliphilus TaxID=1679091 RepID=A0A3N6LSA1_9EURY|nr:hypothetical protein [Natrarchaeobius halalkaliphilus]RQG92773.1 hypothetical protein EA462_00650 [Natrarchaeobius halalkaliphilus]
MLDKLGPLGIAGIVLLLAGIGLIAYADIVIAAGLALVIAGLGIVVKALVTSVLQGFGMF